MENEQVTRYGVAAVVVLYRPEQSVIDNICTYSDQVDVVFAVDNSENHNRDLVFKIKENKKIEYIKNDENKGVAYALNLAASLAIKKKFRFLLTMDQDTVMPSDSVARLLQGREEVGENAGITTIKHFQDPRCNTPLSFVLFTMTSGNLLDLHAYSEVGPFRDDFFIDHIDHEYCLRLNSNGYKVVELNQPPLDHKPGEGKVFKFLIFRINYRIHTPLRLYYFTRNGFLVSKLYEHKYGVFKRFFLTLMFRNVLKCILFSSSRVESLKMIYKGYQDYKRNRMGKSSTY